MGCPRCHGWIGIEVCLNLENVDTTTWIHIWRWLDSEETSDAHTLANRVSRQQTVSTRFPQEVI